MQTDKRIPPYVIAIMALLCLWISRPCSGGQSDNAAANTLSAADALTAIKASVGATAVNPNLDVDGDGAVTSNDARLILQRLVGKAHQASKPQTVQDQTQGAAPVAKGQAEPDRAAKEAKDRQAKVEALLAEAAGEWEAGNVEAALALADEALKLDAKDDKASAEQRRLNEGLEKLQSAVSEARSALQKTEIAAAKAFVANGKAINARYKPIVDLEAEVERAERDLAHNELERTRRMNLIAVGAGECDQENWEGCKSKISSALSGSEKIFGPKDAELVKKAKTLLAKAEQNLENKKKTANMADIDDRIDAAIKAAVARKASECEALWEQAFAKGESGDPQAAIAGYKKVLAVCPNDCSAMNNIGAQARKLGDKATALYWFEAARACKPQEELYKKNADIMKRSLADDKAATTQKAQCDSLYKQAEAADKRGDTAAAHGLSVRLATECGNCAANYNVGLTLSRRGEFEAAKKWFLAGAKCDPKDPDYMKQAQKMDQLIAQKQQPATQGKAPQAPQHTPSAATSGNVSRFDGTYTYHGVPEHKNDKYYKVVIKGGVVIVTYDYKNVHIKESGSVDANGNVSFSYTDELSAYRAKGLIVGNKGSGEWKSSSSSGKWMIIKQ